MDLCFGLGCIQASDNSDSFKTKAEVNKKRYSLKVILLGDSGVGKTTLVQTYCNETQETSFTKGHIRNRFSLVNEKEISRENERVHLRIMDTGGQERYRSITSSYFRHAHCCVLVFDLSNRETLDNIFSWMEDLKFYHTDVDAMGKILVGTLFHSNSREVSYEQGHGFAEHLNMPYVELLSRDSDNIGAIFEIMADKVVEKLKSRVTRISKPGKSQDGLKLGLAYQKVRESVLSCQC